MAYPIECLNLSDTICAAVLESSQDFKAIYFILSIIFWGFVWWISNKKLQEKKIKTFIWMLFTSSRVFASVYLVVIPFTSIMMRGGVNSEVMIDWNAICFVLTGVLVVILGMFNWINNYLEKMTGFSLTSEFNEKFRK